VLTLLATSADNASTEGVKLERAAPISAAKCQSMRQLKAWRHAQLKKLDSVPKAYRNFAEDPIEKEYKENVARIHAAEKSDDKQIDEHKTDAEQADEKKGASGGTAAESDDGADTAAPTPEAATPAGAEAASAPASAPAAAAATSAEPPASGLSPAKVAALAGMCAAMLVGGLAVEARRGRGQRAMLGRALLSQERADVEAPFLRLVAIV